MYTDWNMTEFIGAGVIWLHKSGTVYSTYFALSVLESYDYSHITPAQINRSRFIHVVPNVFKAMPRQILGKWSTWAQTSWCLDDFSHWRFWEEESKWNREKEVLRQGCCEIAATFCCPLPPSSCLHWVVYPWCKIFENMLCLKAT